ncbi:Uma2 family endonuclease [Symbioplanes lichenis]|uniref:Uma2 family endonuclease n=1 Tax=Symbioplanes lichenis TaxID=1629072 RepID=UPI002739292D|nr:Uma2 family endonuclease [Actinoplanes lichenis]
MRDTDPFDRRQWTLAETANIAGDIGYELWDGQLRVPSPSTFTGICEDIVIGLSAHCPPGHSPCRVGYWPGDGSAARPDIVVVPWESSRYDAGCLGRALLGVDVRGSGRGNDPRSYARAGLGRYLVVDPFDPAGATVTDFRLAGDGSCRELQRTHGVFVTADPYPVSLDLPYFSAVRWRAVVEGCAAAVRPAIR